MAKSRISTDDKIEIARKAWLADRRVDFDSILTRCESPIEQLMLAAFLNHGWELANQYDWLSVGERARAFPGLETGRLILCRDDGEHALLVQPTITARGARARADFALIARHDNVEGHQRMAIELDGHDFHERTRQQATRDKARDRRLQLSGWVVLRFTGSEVHADAASIADRLFWEAAGVDTEPTEPR